MCKAERQHVNKRKNQGAREKGEEGEEEEEEEKDSGPEMDLPDDISLRLRLLFYILTSQAY